MTQKVTWKSIFKDFCKRHPNLRKEVIYWRPHNYSEIEIWLADKRKMIYDYELQIAKFM